MRLSDEAFLNIIHATPLISVDLIIHNTEGEILLGRRNNKPAQGFWFVPGGRIYKNETIEKAFQRILGDETGLDFPHNQAKLLGAYDHIYDDNFLGVEKINTHYVVLGFELFLKGTGHIRTDSQHSQTSWWKVEDLLLSEKVHFNTKRYFQ